MGRIHMPVIMSWRCLPAGIFSETIIADGVRPPIRMTSFPSVKTLQPGLITYQPNTTSSQIKILAADQTHVLTINHDVIIRDHDWLLNHGWRRDIDRRCRNHKLRDYKRHMSILINRAAGCQRQASCR